ncbi:hypothetical protein C0J52_02381 [Blattella germanica]|nr:hypothetical protein C0J52_02381 [Blattella germanica]
MKAQNCRKDRKKQKNSAPPLLRITGCNLIRKPKLPPQCVASNEEIYDIMAQSASEMGLRSKHHPLVTREDRRRSSLLRKSSMRMKMKPGDSAESKLTPFYLRWVFGVTNEVRAINLIQPDNPIIFYVGSHAGVLYDVKAKEMRLLHGHKNALESISADSSGRWVATADSGDDNFSEHFQNILL